LQRPAREKIASVKTPEIKKYSEMPAKNETFLPSNGSTLIGFNPPRSFPHPSLDSMREACGRTGLFFSIPTIFGG
jgi:hypothetical protein